jgi:hypothetical protein
MKLRREVVNDAVNLLQKFSTNAARCLITIMNDRESLASVRLAAARTVLEMAFKGIEVDELESRLSALEERIEQLGIQTRGMEKALAARCVGNPGWAPEYISPEVISWAQFLILGGSPGMVPENVRAGAFVVIEAAKILQKLENGHGEHSQAS